MANTHMQLLDGHEHHIYGPMIPHSLFGKQKQMVHAELGKW